MNAWHSTYNGMILIAKWPGFPWAGCRAGINHILIPSIDYLLNLPKTIFSIRRIFICVRKWLKGGIKIYICSWSQRIWKTPLWILTLVVHTNIPYTEEPKLCYQKTKTKKLRKFIICDFISPTGSFLFILPANVHSSITSLLLIHLLLVLDDSTIVSGIFSDTGRLSLSAKNPWLHLR